MAVNAADLMVNVRADTGDAQRKIKALDDSIDRLGGSFDVVGRAARGFGLAATAGFVSLGSQAVLGSILQLGSALAPMAGLLAALPGAAAAGGAAFATLALGLWGVDEAFKQLLKGDMEKFEEALGKLAPSAVEFFRALQRSGPAFSGLRLHVQSALFQGLGWHVDRLARTYIPALHDPMVNIAKQMNLAARAVADFVARADTVMDVRSIFTNTGKAMEPLKRILVDLVAGFLDFATVGASLLPEFMGYVEGLAERFRAWADEARRTGQIEKWIRDGAEAAKTFGEILGNVGGILATVFTGVPGGGLLEHLKNMTQAVEDFLKSTEGQTGLTVFFTSLTTAAAAVGPVLAAAFGAFTQGLMPILANLATAVGPGLTTFLNGLKDALITLAPSATTLGLAVGELLTNLTPLLPHVADFLAKMVEWAAPLIANEKLVLALVAAFVSMKVLHGILTAANAAYVLWNAASTKAIAGVIAKTAVWVASTAAGVASLVVSLGIVVATYTATAAKVIAEWALMAAKSVIHAAVIVAQWVLHSATAAATAVASMVTQAAKVVAQWAVMSAGAALNAAKIVAAWVLHSATAAATAVLKLTAAAAVVVAKWAFMAAQATINAVKMAAAWVIAMGPVAWVTAAVIALAVLIIAKWDTIKAKTIEAWNAMSQKVSDAWDKIVEAVAGAVAKVVAKAVELKAKIIAAFTALPGAMAQAGRDAMAGLARGIGEAGAQAINKAREMAAAVKREVVDFFKIGSPSKVFHEIGVWTGEGLANGMKAMETAVGRAGAGMAAAAVPDVSRGVGLGAGAAPATGASGRSVSVAPGAVQVIIQGNVTEAALPQVQDSVDAALRSLLAEINGGRIPGRVG